MEVHVYPNTRQSFLLGYNVTLAIKFNKVFIVSALLYFRLVSTISRGQIMACKQGVRLLHNRTNVYSGVIVVSSCFIIFC